MVREHGGDGEIVVPPTIHALLQARIDSLDGDVRVVMERGSVEGEVFHRGAVAELSPGPVRPEVGSHLTTLVRKELIRSTPSTFPDDEGFRFRHLLIRDAAYESLPKATRAELHERFADWLAQHDLVESDEIVGYHLEQAHRYRLELDTGDPALAGLAERAAGALSAAGLGAMDRGDWVAARSLLRRACQTPSGGVRCARGPRTGPRARAAGGRRERGGAHGRRGGGALRRPRHPCAGGRRSCRRGRLSRRGRCCAGTTRAGRGSALRPRGGGRRPRSCAVLALARIRLLGSLAGLERGAVVGARADPRPEGGRKAARGRAAELRNERGYFGADAGCRGASACGAGTAGGTRGVAGAGFGDARDRGAAGL